jgi:hypothetical protein
MRFPGVSPTDPIEFLPDAIARAHDIIFVCAPCAATPATRVYEVCASAHGCPA